jgi:solute carrier family 25 folate transporter 32
VQDTPLAKHVPRERYRNTPHALSTIVKSEGLRGLYQGLTPNLLGNVTAWGSYFLGYGMA